MFVCRTGEADVGSEFPVSMLVPTLLTLLVVIYAVLVTTNPLIVITKPYVLLSPPTLSAKFLVSQTSSLEVVV